MSMEDLHIFITVVTCIMIDADLGDLSVFSLNVQMSVCHCLMSG